MNRDIITNLLLFQLGWFACVLGGAYDQVLLGSIIALLVIAYHFYQANDAIQELRLLMVALLIGLVFESTVTAQQFARYGHGQVTDFLAPPWIILMWPLFATTLNRSMRWLKGVTPLLVALVGALFAPLAYYTGSRLGAVAYDDMILSMAIIATGWAGLLPILVHMSLKLDGYSTTSIRLDTKEHPRHV